MMTLKKTLTCGFAMMLLLACGGCFSFQGKVATASLTERDLPFIIDESAQAYLKDRFPSPNYVRFLGIPVEKLFYGMTVLSHSSLLDGDGTIIRVTSQ